MTRKTIKYQIVRAPSRDWVLGQFHLSVFRQVMFAEIGWCMILAGEKIVRLKRIVWFCKKFKTNVFLLLYSDHQLAMQSE